ncbi:unnamed protein product [Penicillium pancosmium]
MKILLISDHTITFSLSLLYTLGWNGHVQYRPSRARTVLTRTSPTFSVHGKSNHTCSSVAYVLSYVDLLSAKYEFIVKESLVRIDQDDMYLRAIHAESDIPTLQEFIQNNPLGVLTTAISSPDFPTLQVSHIPWVIDTAKDASESGLGVLRGHMARQNPQAKTLIESVRYTMEEGAKGGVQLKDEVLVLFTADVHHYVTPKFYRETKPTTGKVVPTWNYSAVQAYGKATVFFDMGSESAEYLSRQIDDLSEHAETSIMGYAGGENLGPWKVSDAPDKYIALMQKAIIGIQIEITSLGGKFKMSQESPEKDREGVIAGFKKLNSEIGKEMARTISDRQDIMNLKK